MGGERERERTKLFDWLVRAGRRERMAEQRGGGGCKKKKKMDRIKSNLKHV